MSLCVYAFRGSHVEVRGQLPEVVLFFHNEGPRDQTQSRFASFELPMEACSLPPFLKYHQVSHSNDAYPVLPKILPFFLPAVLILFFPKGEKNKAWLTLTELSGKEGVQ